MGPSGSNHWQPVSPSRTPSHFFKIILPSTIQDKKLMIPPKFARKFGDELSAVATLSVANGRVWRVGLTKEENDIFFHDGWHEFVEYYSIRHGYFLVFCYKGISNFHVLIFDTTACEINYPFNCPSSEQEADHDKQYPVLNEDEMEDDDSVGKALKKRVSNQSSRKQSMNKRKKRVFNQSSRKQSMNKRYNPSSKQDVYSSKNVNGYWTRSKKCKMEDQVEIEDLVNVKELSRGKIRKYDTSSSHGLLDKTKDSNHNPSKNAENLQAPVHDAGIQISRSKIMITRSCGKIHAQLNEGEHTKNSSKVGSANRNTKPCKLELLEKSEDGMEIIVGVRFSRMYKKTSQERERAIHAAKLFKPKNPSFLVILRPYTFSKFIVCVPAAFARKYLSRDSKYLTLQDSDGREWFIQIKWKYGWALYLNEGWKIFSIDNNLKEGDVCVFELIKMNEVVLKVSIFHVSKSAL